MEKSKIMTIVGLGNIGKEYENSRHNAGFMALDLMREVWNFSEWKEEKKLKALISQGNVSDTKIILAKPTTFMNLSGETVSGVTNFYKIAPESTWIIYDDLDLPLGKIRIRLDGSAGTHNGMKSVLQHLPTVNFPRIRIGIESRGLPPYNLPPQMDTSDFVLSKFTPPEQPEIQKSLTKALKALEESLKKTIESAMNIYNT
jgi:PTH1 family peptidyl-tRNA hydrolase